MARSTKKETPAEELQTDSPTETPSPTEEQQVEVIDVAVDEAGESTTAMPEVTVDDNGIIQIS